VELILVYFPEEPEGAVKFIHNEWNEWVLFQTSKAASSVFTPWGYDQAGVELGYSINNTFIRASVFNGILGGGAPAQDGGLKKSKGDPSDNN